MLEDARQSWGGCTRLVRRGCIRRSSARGTGEVVGCWLPAG
ncbi:hypothetical protein ACFPRL_15560 [Pseudoclavibacter helvolus]